ncbi:dermokine isoform X1 [Heterocephalus glaber]|uniref:Dermokine isoform X1 n=1 Tax=Heterocephalus glaber TaxID=10181 RepID=A0AAX6RG97_HETGA|nr:dermokine isoform X1 [Heterocephalus glaber]
MKLRVSLASLLLALCLGSGAAGPLQGPGTGPGQGMGDTVGNGVGKAIGEGAKEAVRSGIEDAIGQGNGEASSAFREARGDALSNKLGEAAHALENTGREVGRQAENFIRHGTDAAHNFDSWGTSGGHGMFGNTGGQGQGNFGGPGSPWGHAQPGDSEGSFGTNSLGASWGQGGNGRSLNLETNAQGSAAQPGYASVRGSRQNSGCINAPPSGSGGSSSYSRESSSQSGGPGGSSGGPGGSSGSNSGSSHGTETSKDFDQPFSVSKESNSDSSSGSRDASGGGNNPECDHPQNEGRIAGGSESEESRENSRLGSSYSNSRGHGSSGDSKGDEGVNELNSVNSETSPGVFNFDNFWKNFKSKLGFINWDAINKGQVLSPSTRALLYFRRLWEDFKQKTPFFNWKKITEDLDLSLQKRAGGANQDYYYNQQAYPTMSSGQNSVRNTPKPGRCIPLEGDLHPVSHPEEGQSTLLQATLSVSCFSATEESREQEPPREEHGSDKSHPTIHTGSTHTFILGFPGTTRFAALAEVLVENYFWSLLRPHEHQPVFKEPNRASHSLPSCATLPGADSHICGAGDLAHLFLTSSHFAVVSL